MILPKVKQARRIGVCAYAREDDAGMCVPVCGERMQDVWVGVCLSRTETQHVANVKLERYVT